ncbi:protein INCA1 isoform 4-T4 [Liasis olivaceus]
MEGDGGAALGPFVKQSKMVSRNQPEVDPSSRACSTGDFWDRLVQQPSFLWMEEYREAPPLLTSGCAAQRPAVGEGGPWPWQVASTAQSLPSPKELCQKKRKGPKRKGLGNVRALSVFYHLEEAEGDPRELGSAPALLPRKRDGWGPAWAPAEPHQDAKALRKALPPWRRHQCPEEGLNFGPTREETPSRVTPDLHCSSSARSGTPA